MLLEHNKIPEDLARLIYWLLVREEESGFPSIRSYDSAYLKELYPIEANDTLIIVFTQAFDMVLSRLPELRGGTFTVDLHQLANLSRGQLYSLTRLSRWGWHEYATSELEPKERNFDGDYFASRIGGLWRDFLTYKVKFRLPEKTRFEHTHVMGYSGSGKTTLIQQLILADIQTDAGVLVMTPKGQLIPTLERLKVISDDRLIVIRPSDPYSFNLFDLKGSYVHVIDLISFVLDSALGDGGTTSAKQTVLLNYCTSLLLKIPDADLFTLSTLVRMQTLPPEYAPYVDQLSPPQQLFFREDFPKTKDYGETKGALGWRINGLIDNPVVQAMFCHSRTLFDLADELDRGAVVLIDTSEASTGTNGSRFIGRFFIAMLLLFAQRRDTSKNLRPVFAYIDECQSYFHNSIEEILEKSREAKVGMHLIHQHEGQLTKYSTALRDSVKQNTSIKFEATKPYHFDLIIRGQEPISIRTRPDVLSNLPTRTDADLKSLHDANRVRFTTTQKPTPKVNKKKPPSYDDSLSDIE